MITLASVPGSVKTTTTTRRRPTAAALVRAFNDAAARLTALIPGFYAREGRPSRRFIDRQWWPAHKALDRAEDAVVAHLNRRKAAGMVVDGTLYLDLGYCLGDLADHRGTSIVAVALDLIDGIPTGPDPADRDAWAAENTDHHTDEPTPVEVLGDGPDWDGMGEDALAQDSYSRGFLPL